MTHVLEMPTDYYKTGPQQGRPPDGYWPAGTQVRKLKDAGGYTLVQTAAGVQAYVASGVLKPLAKKLSSDVEAVVRGNNDFAWDLYAKLAAEKPGNLFFSPNSISTALAMTYAGARGDTETQMAKALHFEVPQQQLHPAFASLLKDLHADAQRGYQLRIANRLWGQQGYQFLPQFLQITQKDYGAELAQLDFVKQPEPSRQTINRWVAEQTQDKIKDLIPSGAINDLTRLVLTNAIYFKGDWANQFKKEATKEAPFTVSANEKVNVPLMYQQERFAYGKMDGVQLLELPYAGKELSMLVLLPEKVDGLPALEKSLTAANLAKWQKGMQPQKVEVYLPRFTMTSEFMLKDALSALGMPLAFTPGKADFSGMNGERDLFISAAIHKAFVDVNEQGTEAAAATAIVVGVTSVQIVPTFRADHPFVFLIRDNTTNSILFLGRVVNPKG
ncbi:MAG: serpin family protein [Gemmataceae bacterium]